MAPECHETLLWAQVATPPTSSYSWGYEMEGTMGVRRVIDAVSLTALVCGFSGVLGYAAGRLVEGAPDADLWMQAATGLCLLAFAGVQVWVTIRHRRPVT